VQYMLLIYTEPGTDKSGLPEYAAYTNELLEAGVLIGGQPLDDIAETVTVRVRDGQTLPTNGPFAETTEVLGGYYMIDVESIDDAVAWAAKLPSAPYGSVEVRRILEIASM
jgi:hypothetical protein